MPLSHGQALFAAAPEPKRLRVLPGAGHNDLVTLCGALLAEELRQWVEAIGAHGRP